MPKQESRELKSLGSPFGASIKWLWWLFSSVRLALILVLIIAGLSLLGALTQLDVFNSIYFAIPGIMLMFNILVCMLNRWKSTNLILRGGKITQPESFYEKGTELKGIRLSSSEAEDMIEKIFLSHGYRVRKSTGEGIHLAADKNRHFRLGTYLSHFSLILFVVAFLFGFHFGFRDTGFVMFEGETRQVGHDTDLSLKLVSFVYEQYDNGMPKDYRSQVVLYENGQPVRESLIRVNHPLYYEGTRFYQLFFGTTVKIQIRDDKGQMVFDDGVPLSTFHDDPRYYQGYFDLPEQGFTIRLIAPSIADDPMIPAGKLAVGIIQNIQQINLKLVQQDTPTVINGLEFTFQEMLDYSGFQISRDPTNALIWIASGLFIIGICCVFYFPHRQVWALCQTEEEGSRLLMRSLGRAGFDATTEVNNLIKEFESKLPAYKGKA
ncbi:cytochrome c biogenesis protein ResB [Chloroflexota bacterium]